MLYPWKIGVSQHKGFFKVISGEGFVFGSATSQLCRALQRNMRNVKHLGGLVNPPSSLHSE